MKSDVSDDSFGRWQSYFVPQGRVSGYKFFLSQVFGISFFLSADMFNYLGETSLPYFLIAFGMEISENVFRLISSWILICSLLKRMTDIGLKWRNLFWIAVPLVGVVFWLFLFFLPSKESPTENQVPPTPTDKS